MPAAGSGRGGGPSRKNADLRGERDLRRIKGEEGEGEKDMKAEGGGYGRKEENGIGRTLIVEDEGGLKRRKAEGECERGGWRRRMREERGRWRKKCEGRE